MQEVSQEISQDTVQELTRLEDWTIVSRGSNASVLIGRVYGHPQMSDGSAVVTTAIAHIDSRIAETENSIYLLGRALRRPCLEAPGAEPRLQGFIAAVAPSSVSVPVQGS